MKVTILGSGDATGMPVPLCDCEYCNESTRRRNPAVLVETSSTTILFDFGPDIQDQLRIAETHSIDAAFLTHSHGDHSGGIPKLYQAAKWDASHLDRVEDFKPTPEGFDPGYPIYLTDTARGHLEDEYGALDERLDLNPFGEQDKLAINDVTVESFPVEHHRPTHKTVGFLVKTNNTVLGYAPDMRRIIEDPPAKEIDVFVCEGAAILGKPVHGPREELLNTITSLDADRTILMNINEHVQRSHTAKLRQTANSEGFELAEDFMTIDVD